MQRLGLKIQTIKAIFVSHEHTDHISGIAAVSKKYRLPVYITLDTFRNSRLQIERELVKSFSPHEPIVVGSIAVAAFPKPHDAIDPCSFVVECNKIKVGVFTDIGEPCQPLIEHFQHCHAVFLEANYDEEMLSNGRYNRYLKQRISGGNGHLSNSQALEIFIRHRSPFISHLFLSHLSANNNCAKLVSELFNKHANGVKVVVASRHQETAVYKIEGREPGITKFIRNQIPSSQLTIEFV